MGSSLQGECATTLVQTYAPCIHLQLAVWACIRIFCFKACIRIFCFIRRYIYITLAPKLEVLCKIQSIMMDHVFRKQVIVGKYEINFTAIVIICK